MLRKRILRFMLLVLLETVAQIVLSLMLVVSDVSAKGYTTQYKAN